MFMFILILLNVFVAIVCYAYDQACEEAAENPVQHMDFDFALTTFRKRPSAGTCVAVLDAVCGAPKKQAKPFFKRLFSCGGDSSAKVVDEGAVADIFMSVQDLKAAIAKAASGTSANGAAVAAIVTKPRYLKLCDQVEDAAQESANYRVKMREDILELKETNVRLEQMIKEMKEMMSKG